MAGARAEDPVRKRLAAIVGLFALTGALTVAVAAAPAGAAEFGPIDNVGDLYDVIETLGGFPELEREHAHRAPTSVRFRRNRRHEPSEGSSRYQTFSRRWRVDSESLHDPSTRHISEC